MFNDTKIHTIADIQKFLQSCSGCTMHSYCSLAEKADWIRKRLIRFKYNMLHKKEKRILQNYLSVITGCKNRSIKYHITAYKRGNEVCRKYKRNSFPSKYTNVDIELLAETDNLHSRLNGVATRAICREMCKCGDTRYEKLADISVSHLYNLRSSIKYKERSLTVAKTKSVERPIGTRKKPQPNGEPGYIRVDCVHQGDQDGEKGVYHINLVDEIIQWEIVVSVEGLSEYFLLDALEEAIEMFPFIIQNFHSDNGSEFINYKVADLLNRLLINQTKSRSRRSNDNGLVESKNGSVIRKHIGHAHIPGEFSARINKFYREHFIPYINFSRPCAFPQKKILPNGKIKITYPHEGYKTPLQKLLSLPNRSKYLKQGVTIEQLITEARKKTPNQRAYEMQQAKRKLLNVIISLPSDIL